MKHGRRDLEKGIIKKISDRLCEPMMVNVIFTLAKLFLSRFHLFLLTGLALCLDILSHRFSALFFYLRSCLCPWHRDSSPDTRTLSGGKNKTLKGENT